MKYNLPLSKTANESQLRLKPNIDWINSLCAQKCLDENGIKAFTEITDKLIACLAIPLRCSPRARQPATWRGVVARYAGRRCLGRPRPAAASPFQGRLSLPSGPELTGPARHRRRSSVGTVPPRQPRPGSAGPYAGEGRGAGHERHGVGGPGSSGVVAPPRWDGRRRGVLHMPLSPLSQSGFRQDVRRALPHDMLV